VAFSYTTSLDAASLRYPLVGTVAVGRGDWKDLQVCSGALATALHPYLDHRAYASGPMLESRRQQAQGI